MEDPLRTEPVFSPEAQTTFTAGERVWDIDTGMEATYLGWMGDDHLSPNAAVVEWDSHAVTRCSFAEIKPLYR